ncbi:MAG: hypothetical protein ACOC56_01940 [Atribacterota bacterium]
MATKLEKYIKNNDSIPFSITQDDYAYYDENIKRWRAGKFNNKAKQGQFIKAETAKRQRAGAKQVVESVRRTPTLTRQRRRERGEDRGVYLYERFKESFRLTKTAKTIEKEYRQGERVAVSTDTDKSLQQLAYDDALQQEGYAASP